MNIHSKKIALVKLILNIDNPDLLNRIKEVLFADKDFWEALSEEEQAEILLGIDELDRGDALPYEDAMKKFRA